MAKKFSIVPQTIMRFGEEPPEPPDFDRAIEEWDRKATEHMEQAQRGQERLQELSRELEAVYAPPPEAPLLKQVFPDYETPEWLDWLKKIPSIKDVVGKQAIPIQVEPLRAQIMATEAELERNDFYTRLYGQVPAVIAGGALTDPDEILTALELPQGLPSTELDEIRDTISGMVDTLTGVPSPEEIEVPELPELVVPTKAIGPPTTISKLTVDEIIKSLTAPKVPPPVMSEEEWATFMVESGQISDKADLVTIGYMQDEADRIVAEWQERNNRLAAFRSGIAEMPDYKLIDMAREMLIQPGLALLETAGMYFEHVSMPLAGAVYKTFIPDIDVEYQRLRKTESTWQALGHAWEEWDSPGEGAAEWILKYMLMEGLVDPITYAGWGLATRLTKPLGGVGRLVGTTERGIASVLELPFDMIKWPFRATWSAEWVALAKKAHLPQRLIPKVGEMVIPRTVAQNATIAMHKTGQYVDKYLTTRFGRAVYMLTMKEWQEGAEVAIKHVLKHPQVDNDITRAGREFLRHKPVTEKEVLDWAQRLETTLRPEDITKQTVEAVDRVFEDFFSKLNSTKKLLTNREASDELVRVLHGKDPDMSVIAGKILKTRSRQIINSGLSFGQIKSPFAAMRALMRRNFRTYIATEESLTALARKEQGRVVVLLENANIRVQKAWQNGIDKIIIRPFAESYLTFALYGPMNVIEDVIRTMLGGVHPGGKSAKAFARRHAGTTYDQTIVTESSVSETLGFLKSTAPESGWNNWILQLGGLAPGFGRTLFTYMTRVPGQISMAMRRHFIDVRYTQIMKQIGGDQMERLTAVGPDKLMGVTGKRMVRDIQQQAMELKMQGLPEALKAAKAEWTRANILRREMNEVLTEHPDLPRPVRDHVAKAYDDGTLFGEAGISIDRTIRGSYDVMVDDFVHSAEYAHRGFEQLSDMLTQLEVRNPQEMAQLIQSLNTMSSVYGATPKQILGRAVERTRGLPATERRTSIDKALDDITMFREKAGVAMDKVVERIKVQMRGKRELGSISPSVQRGWLNKTDMPFYDNIINRPDLADYFATEKGVQGRLMEVTPDEALQMGAEVHGVSIQEELRIIDDEVVSRYVGKMKAGDEFPMPVIDYVTKNQEGRHRLLAARELGREKVPILVVDKPMTPFTPTYISKAENLFNLQTAKRVRSAEVGEEINAWRHEWFAAGKPEDIAKAEWWDDFYREVTARHHLSNVEMADFDGMIKSAIDDLDIAGGLPARQRPPIKVVDRELAPQDVAQMIGARGDDVSRALLDTLTAQNDRDMFTAYVMAHVKPDDIGFSKESVGVVFDQISSSLNVPAGKMDWLAARQIELEAVRRDFHALYNSKLLPDHEIAKIGRFFDDTADAVQKEMFDAPDVIYKGVGTYEPSGGVGGSWFTSSRGYAETYGKKLFFVERPKNLKVYDSLDDFLGDMGKDTMETLTRDDFQFLKGRLSREGYEGIQHPMKVFGADEVWMFEKPALKPIKDLPTGKLRSEFKGYNDLRQQAMDEAHKWYYKEFTDYSNANMFDALMKAIYPFWTYESQRWFWLPRSFVRHPGTFTSFERWQNNTDYGYLHIPGTSADIGIGRGTVYGTLQTRLTRRDYPEYYDSLGAAGDAIEFSDFLSRYGFYPGAHIGIPLSVLGGVEMQFGEAMPAIVKTPLQALIAMYPDSEAVRWISDRVFADRFRNYMAILAVTRMGGDGSLIFTKQQEGIALTPEEEQLWTDGRREAALYGVGFEQFALFRFRTDEQYKMYEQASKVIEEMTGYTSDQQDWLRKHNYRIWDMVGGMSPTEQAVLQEMDYYRWVGNIRPLLPGRQQEVLNKIELGWDAVTRYGETVQEDKLQLQRDFLTGARGPDDYNKQLLDLYDKQRAFIDNKIEEYPLMSLENRAEYYKEFKVPQPVLHPFRELLNLYFSIELKEVTDPETGEKVMDWDNFWGQRQAVEDAIPDDLKHEWTDFLSRNSTQIEEVRREVYHNYFRTYNKVWEKILSTYDENEQAMIEEYLHLERTNQQLDRQAEIKATKSEKTGLMLISSFRSEVSDAKKALRYHNPALDAWLFYWGKTSTFTSPTGQEVYTQIAKDTGRRI